MSGYAPRVPWLASPAHQSGTVPEAVGFDRPAHTIRSKLEAAGSSQRSPGLSGGPSQCTTVRRCHDEQKRERKGAHLFQNTPSGTQLATRPRETTRTNGREGGNPRIVDSLSSEPQQQHLVSPTRQCHGRGFSDQIETHFHGRPFWHTSLYRSPADPTVTVNVCTQVEQSSRLGWCSLCMVRYLLFRFSADQVNRISILLQTPAGMRSRTACLC